MGKVNTVKIKSTNSSGFMVINESDFDQAEHRLFGNVEPDPRTPPGRPIDTVVETDHAGRPIDTVVETDHAGRPIDTVVETDHAATPDVTQSVDDLSKDDLVRLADQMGLEVDKRWSEERIREHIKEAMDQT